MKIVKVSGDVFSEHIPFAPSFMVFEDNGDVFTLGNEKDTKFWVSRTPIYDNDIITDPAFFGDPDLYDDYYNYEYSIPFYVIEPEIEE